MQYMPNFVKTQDSGTLFGFIVHSRAKSAQAAESWSGRLCVTLESF
jgi:hypothetical protein